MFLYLWHRYSSERNVQICWPYLFLPFCQALLHASVALNRKLVVDWVPSCDLEDSTAEEVSFIYVDQISSALLC